MIEYVDYYKDFESIQNNITEASDLASKKGLKEAGKAINIIYLEISKIDTEGWDDEAGGQFIKDKESISSVLHNLADALSYNGKDIEEKYVELDEIVSQLKKKQESYKTFYNNKPERSNYETDEAYDLAVSNHESDCVSKDRILKQYKEDADEIITFLEAQQGSDFTTRYSFSASIPFAQSLYLDSICEALGVDETNILLGEDENTINISVPSGNSSYTITLEIPHFNEKNDFDAYIEAAKQVKERMDAIPDSVKAASLQPLERFEAVSGSSEMVSNPGNDWITIKIGGESTGGGKTPSGVTKIPITISGSGLSRSESSTLARSVSIYVSNDPEDGVNTTNQNQNTRWKFNSLDDLIIQSVYGQAADNASFTVTEGDIAEALQEGRTDDVQSLLSSVESDCEKYISH